jgi:tryptophan synthase alpha subunit
MGYYNPLLAYGERAVADDCAAAGVDGFIVVDLPPEHSGPFLAHCDRHGLGLAPLATPLTSDERLRAIGAVARGFVYCVSLLGVTGNRAELPPDLPEFVARVAAAIAGAPAPAGAGGPAPSSSPLPLAVGFGLSTPQHVAQVGALPGVGGVVMGTSIVKAMEAGGVDGLRAFLHSVVPRRAAPPPS